MLLGRALNAQGDELPVDEACFSVGEDERESRTEKTNEKDERKRQTEKTNEKDERERRTEKTNEKDGCTGFVLWDRWGGPPDISWQSSPIGAVGCTGFVLGRATGHQLAVVAYRGGRLHWICTMA